MRRIKCLYVKELTNGKNEIYEEKKIFIIEYNLIKRIIFLLIYAFMMLLGIFFILINNLFTILVGILIVITIIIKLTDMLLFKKLVIYETYIVKQWYFFGNIKIKFSEIKVTLVLRIWTGQIFFSSKRFFDKFIMSLELFPIIDFKEKLNILKSILVQKNIIKGDEHEWNY